MTDTERLDWLDAVGFTVTPMHDTDCRWCIDDRNEVSRTRYWWGMTLREAIDAAHADCTPSLPPSTPPDGAAT